jgi:hypothetical protein
MEKTNWPQKVRVEAENVVELLKPTLQEEDPTPEYLVESISEIFFECFTKGEEFQMTEEQFEYAFFKARFNQELDQMKEDGLIDWVEDANGEDIIFMTKKGKSIFDISEEQ